MAFPAGKRERQKTVEEPRSCTDDEKIKQWGEWYERQEKVEQEDVNKILTELKGWYQVALQEMHESKGEPTGEEMGSPVD